MNKLDRLHIALRVSSNVVEALRLDPETKHLKTFTKAHSDAWVKGVEEIIEDLQKAIEGVRKNSTRASGLS